MRLRSLFPVCVTVNWKTLEKSEELYIINAPYFTLRENQEMLCIVYFKLSEASELVYILWDYIEQCTEVSKFFLYTLGRSNFFL